MSNDDDEDTFFVIILPVTIVIFISIFSYLFIGYMRLKKYLLNSGQVISAVPFLILPEEQPEIRSPDGQLPPPAYNTVVETEYENFNNNTNNNHVAIVNYNHPSLTHLSLDTNNTTTGRRERHHNCTRSNTQHATSSIPPANVRGGGGMLISQGEVQQSGPPSIEMMLERPPPLYSIECATEALPICNERNGRRTGRKQTRPENIAMIDIAPPPYSPSAEVSVI